jgi:hypothetical protein
MKAEVVYDSGQTYNEYIEAGTARISQNAKRVIVQFKSNGSGKTAGKFTMTHDDAERLAHALLRACSAGDVTPIEFSIGESCGCGVIEPRPAR